MIGEDAYFLKMGGYRPTLLKLKNYKHKPMSLKQWLDWFLRSNRRYATLYLNNKLQCPKGKDRSLGDIFRIAKYYYPSCSFIEVRRLILKNRNMAGHYCRNINRRIYAILPGWNKYGIGSRDEFGFIIYYYDGPVKCKRSDIFV